jgi:hypothetical protein
MDLHVLPQRRWGWRRDHIIDDFYFLLNDGVFGIGKQNRRR